MAIRVVIADDSAAVRLAFAAAFRRMPGVEVVATASDGVDVVGKVLTHRPDMVTLDYEMPNRSGLDAAIAIHRHLPNTLMVMISSVRPEVVRSALAVAPDVPIEFLPKPSASDNFENWLSQMLGPLLERIRDNQTLVPGEIEKTTGACAGVEVVLVGASTGGPAAVTTFLSQLSPGIGVPVVIVQHMPPNFTETFAASLDGATAWKVREAFDGAVLRPGEAWVARGGMHLQFERTGRSCVLKLDEGPREHGCRPAVDVMFRSAAQVFGRRCVAVVLTGMGRDGTPGAKELSAAGACFAAQDQATSVVWGMPGALASAGLAEAVLPLNQLAGWVEQKVKNSRKLGAR